MIDLPANGRPNHLAAHIAAEECDVPGPHREPVDTVAAVTVIYELDGRLITTLETFWTVMGETVNGPDGYFGRNLDAFADCLRGGFGTPDDGDFRIVWRDHAFSRTQLGYPETVRQLRRRLLRCHPTNRPTVRAELAEATSARGSTVFDWLVRIFNDEAPGALRLV
jgi:RNAse (barnase) inhibitor barstar